MTPEEQEEREEFNENEREPGELPKGDPEKAGYMIGIVGGLIGLSVGSLLLGIMLGVIGGAATLTYRWILQ